MKHIESRRQHEKINYLSVCGLQPCNELIMPFRLKIHKAVYPCYLRYVSANRPIELVKNCFEVSPSFKSFGQVDGLSVFTTNKQVITITVVNFTVFA